MRYTRRHEPRSRSSFEFRSQSEIRERLLVGVLDRLARCEALAANSWLHSGVWRRIIRDRIHSHDSNSPVAQEHGGTVGRVKHGCDGKKLRVLGKIML